MAVRLSVASITACALLAACNGDNDRPVEIAVIGDASVLAQSGKSLPYAARLVRSATIEGLVGFDEQGRVIPALAGLKGTPLALDLAPVDEVRTMAGRVIELRLSRPEPDLLQLLAQPELGLARKGRGAGPMLARRDKSLVTLKPIAPTERGVASRATCQA